RAGSRVGDHAVEGQVPGSRVGRHSVLSCRMIAGTMNHRPSSGQEGSMPGGTEAPLLTRAERTHYRETSLHADVLRFVRAVRRRAPDLVRLGSMGRSAEGRDLVVAVLSGRGALTPAAARRVGLPIVMVIANIHAGEVEGKEALQALMRELTLGELRPLLDQLTLVLVPDYNSD